MSEPILDFVKDFRGKYGEPSLIVCCRCYKFPLKEITRGSAIELVTLPDVVWPHAKIYAENVLSRSWRIEVP
jgi:hypothetical protein